ncbi:isoquinoline 1-oxidoreductase [Pontibacter ummariensis]|uniref:Isoquinoline 1-oxidoreductase n=1 Tax=Pontibacter ummariensis TaxID=1610492 RepID=A0A239DFC1_9BACT|nr:molybdopterin cofactor-binding domain-containing protein [Pontibacter ummariensis]PRY14377.1 isoquinoline 1-oxidoreductase [Pontibacter ummariensis]SNS30534.1 isoquinoline 1-oxidoreductase [Pontibacter ummariensis]
MEEKTPTFDPNQGTEQHRAGKTDKSRRRFFKLLGGGIAVTFVLQDAFALLSDSGSAPSPRKAFADEVDAWLHIGENNKVTVYTGKVEVGQNIRTSLAQVVAEELQLPIGSIDMVMGDTALTPYDAGTFGSRTTPSMGPQLRRAAATAREIVLDLAAKEWNTDKHTLSISNGQVLHPGTNESKTFGELTKGKEFLKPLAGDVPLTPASAWKVAGTSVPKVNGEEILTGKHKYVSDMKLPGMLYGKVLRAPSFKASLKSADLSAAKALPGVVAVQEGDFIGVAAPDPQTAEKAIKAIKVQWQEVPQPSRAELFSFLKENASGGGGRGSTRKGSIERGMNTATQKLKSSYTVDYIAHAPMEPRAALAQWENGHLTVWTGTQRPFAVRDDLARAFGLPQEKVRVLMPDTGSAYGGKHTGEAALEAARLAKAAQKSVTLTWTREEEFTWAYFRPAGLIEVYSGVTEDGTLTAWEFQNYNSGASGIHTPYVVPHQQIQHHPVDSPLRQGSYRGLASTANIFVIESQMDDLANLVGMDPLAFRLKNLDEPRLRAVFEAAAKGFGWGSAKPAPNHGFGVGGGTEKGGFTATCAEVAVDPGSGEVKVVRTTTAFECGAVVNPAHLDNQILGAIVQGLGGALFEAVDFGNGKILNPHFAQYRVPRFKDTPAIEIIQLDRKDLPSAGAGEAPIVGIAPAIRNAIAQATGIRLKSLPLVPKGMKGMLGSR